MMRKEEIYASRSTTVLRNVGRCPKCGGTCEMPCKLCATREVVRVNRQMARLRERDLLAMHTAPKD